MGKKERLDRPDKPDRSDRPDKADKQDRPYLQPGPLTMAKKCQKHSRIKENKKEETETSLWETMNAQRR